MNSTRTQMEGLLREYGYERVKLVYDYIWRRVTSERQDGRKTIQNPAGLLVKYLKEGWELPRAEDSPTYSYISR
jgi:hypothetical protein